MNSWPWVETPMWRLVFRGLPTRIRWSSAVPTYRLVQGYFACQALGEQLLKGVSQPIALYQVLQESGVRSRLEAAGATGLTPLVGRDSEVALLLERWQQSAKGMGQVVMLSGEAGIGKSRLVELVRERVAPQDALRLVWRCSPYHTNSALYPVIDHLQRLLHWRHDEAPTAVLARLEHLVQTSGGAPEEMVPLLAALLSLPPPERYPPLRLSPEVQKHQTLAALVAWFLAEAARQPVLAVWEDLHWADPLSLELLSLLLAQVPTARLLLLLTARPEFQPSWGVRSLFDAAHAYPPGASASRGYDPGSDWRESLAPGGRRAGHCQDRRCAAVRRRARQDGTGLRPGTGVREELRADWPPAATGNSSHLAGFLDGPAGSAR